MEREIWLQVLACSGLWACVDELKVALGCRFALDVFIVAQQDYFLADQDSVICGSQHLWTGTLIGPFLLLITASMKVHTNLTSLFSIVASVELARVPPERLLAHSERRQAQVCLVSARRVRCVRDPFLNVAHSDKSTFLW